jgi:altronate dehydratase
MRFAGGTSESEICRSQEIEMRLAIQVHPSDNVVTVVEETAAGEEIRYMTPQGPRQLSALEQVPSGHKVALQDIEPQQEIIKYGQPIGLSSKKIRKGEHIHVHNVRSAVQGAALDD